MIRALTLIAAFLATATAIGEARTQVSISMEGGSTTITEGRCTVRWYGGPPYGDWLYELRCEPVPAPSSVAGAAAAPSVGGSPLGPPVRGKASHYGVSYHGQPMGCTGKLYNTDDATIIAVSPAQYREWPCGTALRISGPAGSIVGTRQDACPGCTSYWVDLSEAAFLRVCGAPYVLGICAVDIEVLR